MTGKRKHTAYVWGMGLLAPLLCLFCLGLPATLAAAGQEEPRLERQTLQMLPWVGMSLEYGGFIKNQGVSSSLFRRQVELDLVQYGPHIIFLTFDETTSIGVPGNAWDPNRVDYRMYVPGYRYELRDHYLGLYFDHRCLNNYQTTRYQGNLTGRVPVSIYLFSLEFLTKSMRLGMKDYGLTFDRAKPFQFLWRLNYRASVGKLLSQDPNSLGLAWGLRGQVRLDVCRLGPLVPYLEGGTEVWQGPSWRFFPWGEAGVRYHLGPGLDLIPYLQGGRRAEVSRLPESPQMIRQGAQGFLQGGMRLEAALDAPPGSQEGWGILPEIHGNATFNWVMYSKYFGWWEGIELDLEVLRRKPWTIFFYSDLKLDPRKSDLALLKARYRLQYGLTYSPQGSCFAEGFVEHSRRLDAREFHQVSEGYNNVGLRLGTAGMKPGHTDDGIFFDGRTFEMLNLLRGQMSMGHFFRNRDWQYLWNLNATGRWDVCRISRLVPYVQGELTWLNGGGRTPEAVEYAGELGTRLHGKFDLAFYFRFQHQVNALYFRGPADNRSMVGVRGMF